MTEWFYARGGQQKGPVSYEQLSELARSGGLSAESDLVWNASMKDWVSAGKVPGLFTSIAATNPFAPPSSTWEESAVVSQSPVLQEIPHGSEPIRVMECIKRGFTLTCRHFGKLCIVGLVYMICTIAITAGLGLMDYLMGWGPSTSQVTIRPVSPDQPEFVTALSQFQRGGSVANLILNQVFSMFLSIGLVRIGLDLVSGKEFSVGKLFGGGRKLLPMIGASIIFWVIFVIGLVLLVVPGIYLFLRLSNYMTAMVDRDLGPIESLKYSWSITTNNTLKLFGLVIMYLLIALAGLLALCVGIFFAMPVIWLSSVVAYRWMQYGQQATLDHPGSETPLLAKL
jgi:hypothetical protein